MILKVILMMLSQKKYKNPLELIGNYDIDEELFDYLKHNGMIRYSNDMAYLYGFTDTKGYDSNPRHYGVGSSYKWAKKKGPILVKQRKGQLNYNKAQQLNIKSIMLFILLIRK